MRKEDRIYDLALLLSVLATKISVLSSKRLFDINSQAEDLMIPVLNKIFDLNLKNLNVDNPLTPAIDLFDEPKGFGVQVTSEDTLKK
ncbi:MAG: SMEK domain-containing protein [Saprospirales bacterium]|nr:SMEK domain-containing protein [Saprospirales bacterium]